MAKPKKKATMEEKLAKDRLRKKEKYAEIKNDPEKYKIQKEKDRKKYLLRKEKKKILSIVDMSDRQKREQRRRWRKSSRKYLNKLKEQKKLENILLQNSPPDSEPEENLNIANPAERDPLMEIEETPKAIPNSGKRQGTSIAIRKMRYRSRKVISNLQKEIDKLKKEKDMLRKQLYTERKLQKVNKTIDTIEKKVDQVISDIKADKVEKVKKKLMFNEAINRGVSEKYKNLAKKEKRNFVKSIVDDSKLKKYRVLSKLSFALKKKSTEKEVQKKKTAIIKRRVQDFLQEDENSQVAPGKNEYVKIGGLKKQKRYLTDNFKKILYFLFINCHGEANKENGDEIKLKYDVDDWVIVEYKMKKNSQYFIGRIMETKRNTQSYTINFLRKVPGKSVKFGWPVIGDDDVVPESHILQCLEKPVESRRGQFTFSYLPNLNIK